MKRKTDFLKSKCTKSASQSRDADLSAEISDLFCGYANLLKHVRNNMEFCISSQEMSGNKLCQDILKKKFNADIMKNDYI